ncbi:MAG: hypothetical protein M3114_08260 [Thermoproteota archaeon]|nr:hypothetical protein [Thermoproteota archaeon]MDQ4067564.1 hypothetical protein [Thermoproteota archaeon]
MSEKATKRYKEAKNKGFETVGDNRIPEPIYDFTKPEGQVKAAGPRYREDSNSVINDYPIESIAKESNSTKNNEAKLRTTSDKEC